MTEPLIEFDRVERVYGHGHAEVRALAGVDFQVQAGEFVAVMGPSGSGKSTTMNILGCLDVPTAGTYRFRGVDVGALTRQQRALLRRHYLGFVFQGFNLLNRTSAIENVELPLVYRGTPASERRRRAREALAAVGLTGWESHTPAELSGGQMQRVAIARAIVTDPTVLLADEPTGDLDARSAADVLTLLQRLNAEFGKTIVMVTHDPHAAERSRRVLHLEKGSLVETIPVSV
jgi:putative ABC transport system ATP-binding protein